jgi:hypothetical protein
VFRTREFEQMELEFFVPPDEADQWYEYWCQSASQWYVDHGIPSDKLRLRAHDADELSHYSSGTSDVEFLFPWGWDELEGIANRGDYDLTQHAEHSGEKLDYFDQATNERYVPHVIEPAAGATRTMMAFLMAAYDEEEVRGETRTVLRLHHRIAPYQVAVLPLSKKDTLIPRPRRCSASSSRTSCATTTRPRPSAGATAARTSWARPYCVTIDFDSLEDQGGHRARPRLDGPGPGRHRRASVLDGSTPRPSVRQSTRAPRAMPVSAPTMTAHGPAPICPDTTAAVPPPTAAAQAGRVTSTGTSSTRNTNGTAKSSGSSSGRLRPTTAPMAVQSTQAVPSSTPPPIMNPASGRRVPFDQCEMAKA